VLVEVSAAALHRSQCQVNWPAPAGAAVELSKKADFEGEADREAEIGFAVGVGRARGSQHDLGLPRSSLRSSLLRRRPRVRATMRLTPSSSAWISSVAASMRPLV